MIRAIVFALLLAQAAPPTPTPKYSFTGDVNQGHMTSMANVVSVVSASKTVALLPYADAGNMDVRCVIVYPRDGKLGWLIDRKENTATIFYIEMPTPGFCKEEPKK